jgi:hypothetical protein
VLAPPRRNRERENPQTARLRFHLPSGVGTNPHIAGELFNLLADV